MILLFLYFIHKAFVLAAIDFADKDIIIRPAGDKRKALIYNLRRQAFAFLIPSKQMIERERHKSHIGKIQDDYGIIVGNNKMCLDTAKKGIAQCNNSDIVDNIWQIKKIDGDKFTIRTKKPVSGSRPNDFFCLMYDPKFGTQIRYEICDPNNNKQQFIQEPYKKDSYKPAENAQPSKAQPIASVKNPTPLSPIEHLDSSHTLTQTPSENDTIPSKAPEGKEDKSQDNTGDSPAIEEIINSNKIGNQGQSQQVKDVPETNAKQVNQESPQKGNKLPDAIKKQDVNKNVPEDGDLHHKTIVEKAVVVPKTYGEEEATQLVPASVLVPRSEVPEMETIIVSSTIKTPKPLTVTASETHYETITESTTIKPTVNIVTVKETVNVTLPESEISFIEPVKETSKIQAIEVTSTDTVTLYDIINKEENYTVVKTKEITITKSETITAQATSTQVHTKTKKVKETVQSTQIQTCFEPKITTILTTVTVGLIQTQTVSTISGVKPLIINSITHGMCNTTINGKPMYCDVDDNDSVSSLSANKLDVCKDKPKGFNIAIDDILNKKRKRKPVNIDDLREVCIPRIRKKLRCKNDAYLKLIDGIEDGPKSIKGFRKCHRGHNVHAKKCLMTNLFSDNGYSEDDLQELPSDVKSTYYNARDILHNKTGDSIELEDSQLDYIDKVNSYLKKLVDLDYSNV